MTKNETNTEVKLQKGLAEDTKKNVQKAVN